MNCFNIISISCIILYIFKVIVVDKTYLKPLFSCNKSLNKSIMLLFSKKNESLKPIPSATSTLYVSA